ncbi:MAG: geranylgeranyl pyrophosphate synthase, partial [Saprospiraceae bacterium]
DTGSLDYSYQVALGEVKAAQRALELLPETPYRKALYELADFSIKRKY